MTQLNKIVKGVLLAILIISIILVIYLVVFHNPGQDYTEFYIVDHNNNTTDFPINITQNSVEKIYIGITNQEHQDINYTIEIKKNNKTIFTDVKSLKDKENIQFPYYMDQTKNKGINQTINIELYKNDENNPYRTLFLRYNVI
ncbi:MAG: DUF1616 domain-containing protein [Methanosphaera stadtmanae]|nr:DUF1616 domain-containing protein [Methanosphaera stadtmanae]